MDNSYNNILFNIIKKLNSLNNLDIDVNDISIKDDDDKVIITLNKNGINSKSDINIKNENDDNITSITKEGINTKSDINIKDENDDNITSITKEGINTNKLIINNDDINNEEHLLMITNNNNNIFTVNKDDIILHYNTSNLWYLNFNDFNVFYSKCKIIIGESDKFSYIKKDNDITSTCYISGYQLLNQKITYFTNIHTEFDPYISETYENCWLFLDSLIFDNDKKFSFRYDIKKPSGEILEKENQKYIGSWLCCEETNSDEPFNHSFYSGAIIYQYKLGYDSPEYTANCYPYLFQQKGDAWSMPWINKTFKFIFENILINQQLLNDDEFVVIK